MTLCYLEGDDLLGNNRFARNINYLEYYSRIQDLMGFDTIYFIDNGSSAQKIKALEDYSSCPHVVFKYENLERQGGLSEDYPYCWRGLYQMERLIQMGYEKIIFLDSDLFILNKSLTEYVRQTQSGWVSLWCRKYRFPESSFQILCQDSFHLFRKYTEVPWQKKNGILMERNIPFTVVNKDYICDRFGEDNIEQNSSMDCYAQSRLTIPLRFED